MLGSWIFTDDDCKRAGQCMCGFCKREGSCDFGDCRRPAEVRVSRQGNGRPACKRCARSRMVTLALGYKVAGTV